MKNISKNSAYSIIKMRAADKIQHRLPSQVKLAFKSAREKRRYLKRINKS